jgi:hypothetical protein
MTCNAKLAAVKAQIEFDSHFSIQSETLSVSEGVTSHSKLASAAVKAQKAKFRFPSSDPADNVVIDTRTPEQKMSDILRIWSQLLTKDETKIWNEISHRDLTNDVSLKSGLRTTKSIIASEIKKFRENASEKSQMLRTLKKLPELLLPDSDQVQLSDQSDIPLSIGPQIDSCLDPDFISSYCTPSPGTKVDQSVNHQQVKSDINFSNLYDTCTKQVLNKRDEFKNRVKIQTIFRKNHRLLFVYMILLKTKCTLTGRMATAFKKLLNFRQLSMRIIKRICMLLKTKELIEEDWLMKPISNLDAHSVDLGLMINATINGQTICCILDTGSTFTLIPHKIWKLLKLNPTMLDSSVVYNINSASHKVTDAVLGRISLPIQITTSEGEIQSIFQTCLVLKEHLDLEYVLLGNDFLTANSVNISYGKDSKAVSINNKNVKMSKPSAPCNMVDIFSMTLKKNSSKCKNVTPNPLNKPLPNVPATSLPEISPDIPPDFSKPGSKMSSNDYLLDQDSRTDIEKFFNLCPEDDQGNIAINAFLSDCKSAKYNYYNQTFVAYSAYDPNLDEMVKQDFEKKSIIPDEGLPCPKPSVAHLPPDQQERMNKIIARHSKLFSRSKHHLGKFVGFQAVAHMDTKSKINCKQPPRNRILPKSCKQDLMKYLASGLFEHSQSGTDHYCSNITLVLRNQIKEQRCETKADKYLVKHTKNDPISKLETKPLKIDASEQSEKSLYRMTLDFRMINQITLNEKTSQLPSIQAIENNFHNAIVSTIDLSNCYPTIELEESSRRFFNFYVEDKVWTHNRLAQGWSASLAICQRAVLWTFRDEVLKNFMDLHHLTAEQFPMKSFREFVAGFVDDISIFSSKDHPDPEEIHFLCIEAVFYALESAGWLVKLEVSTFLNPDFVFLGLKWCLTQNSSMIQNDRVAAILNHRPPRSVPELASRLATLQYYQNFLPLMKRLAIPLYKIIKENKFRWTIVEAESYANLLYLMGLQIRNYIFDPTKPLMLMADGSAVESSLLIFQWNADLLSLDMVSTKSMLLTTALRNQAAIHIEAFGVDRVLELAKPYLFQSLSPVNYLFTDASSISYVSRNKPFSSFLQALSETMSMYPSLTVVHMPGRALWYVDILSRQHDYVAMQRTDTNVSEEQAKLTPNLNQIKTGAILTHSELLKLFSTPTGPEILDVSDSDFRYVQRIDWSM